MPLAPLACAGGAVLLLAVDTATRRLLQRRLERLGCTVLVADTGREGVNVARTTPIRLTKVVADLALPDLADGALLGSIREYRPSSELFVLATTPSVTTRTVLPAGTTILPPPVDIPALLELLAAAA
jgi:DNA-binding response OmpR family regulator